MDKKGDRKENRLALSVSLISETIFFLKPFLAVILFILKEGLKNMRSSDEPNN